MHFWRSRWKTCIQKIEPRWTFQVPGSIKRDPIVTSGPLKNYEMRGIQFWKK